jgi:hypothetical protein
MELDRARGPLRATLFGCLLDFSRDAIRMIKSNVINRERDRINLQEEYEVRHWTKELGVTPEKLKETVDHVGVMVTSVREALGK